MVVTPETSASSACCGQIQWMWVSIPPAVTIFPSAAITSVGFAHGEDPPVLDADIGLHDPPVIDDQRVGENQIHAGVSGHLPLAHAVADHLPAAEFDFFAVDREIVLHFDPQLAIGQPHFIPRGGAEHIGIRPA